MKQNMGTIDRGIRTSLALVVAILYFTENLSGLAAIILGASFAIVFLLTSIIGFCPLYTALGIRTTKNKTKG